MIDAPPLLAVTDAALLARLADGAVLVVRHGRTKRDELVRAVQALKAVNAPLLGTVVNGKPVGRRDEYSYRSETVPGMGALPVQPQGQSPEEPQARSGQQVQPTQVPSRNGGRPNGRRPAARTDEPSPEPFPEPRSVTRRRSQ